MSATGAPSGELRIGLRRPLDAQSNNLYDLWTGDRHLIVKEYLKPEEQDDAPAREFAALQRLAEHDIAPQPLFYDPALGPMVVYEYMDGEMWDRRVPAPGELAQLAALWLRLHDLPVDGLWLSRGQDQSVAEMSAMIERFLRRYAAWAESEFPAGKRPSRYLPRLLSQFGDALARLSEMPAQLRFGRADARFANVISRPNGALGMVDWEDSGLRDPARDLGDLLTHPNQEDLLDLDGWQPFLMPYLAECEEIDPTIHERLHLFLAAFPVFWLATLLNVGVSRAQSGTIGDWVINGLPKNQQLRRYIARALAWPDGDIEEMLAALADITFFPKGDHGR